MRHLDDGVAAITYEDRGGTLRALAGIPAEDEELPKYIAVGEVTRLNADIAKLHAFAGEMSRRHMRLIARLLLDQGYRLAYIDRADGHVMPFATRITAGDWVGWWRLDLVELRMGGR